MGNIARIRINEHRLVREPTAGAHEVHLAERRVDLNAHARMRRDAVRQRSIIHLVVFVLAFIFTTGAVVLGSLVWVHPDELASIVFTGLFAGVVFVGSFAVLRFLTIVHIAPDRYALHTGEEEHHVAKSVAYGLIALVFAMLLAGFLINTVTAFTL
jgi:hypothetical protein